LSDVASRAPAEGPRFSLVGNRRRRDQVVLPAAMAALKGLALAGLSEQEIERFVIPQRTRRHRAERNQPLTVEESDRAVRLLRVQTLAEETFGNHEKASRWLRRALTELDGETPLVIAQTEAGARVIETILGKIAWGAAA
jgi:putative toxin-antitoxin system antitoxin component (TIGR02293 family)